MEKKGGENKVWKRRKGNPSNVRKFMFLLKLGLECLFLLGNFLEGFLSIEDLEDLENCCESL